MIGTETPRPQPFSGLQKRRAVAIFPSTPPGMNLNDRNQRKGRNRKVVMFTTDSENNRAGYTAIFPSTPKTCNRFRTVRDLGKLATELKTVKSSHAAVARIWRVRVSPGWCAIRAAGVGRRRSPQRTPPRNASAPIAPPSIKRDPPFDSAASGLQPGRHFCFQERPFPPWRFSQPSSCPALASAFRLVQ
jgi:hypothetical protein